MTLRSLVAATLLLHAAAAHAVTYRRPPEPSGPDLPARFGLDATISPALFDGVSIAAGVRARVRDDPFQFELSYDRDLTTGMEPDFRWLLLGGGGLARQLRPRWTLYGSFLLGAYGVAVRDVDGVRWRPEFGPVVGARVQLSRGFPLLRVLSVEPTVGLSTTLLVAGTGHDNYRRVDWGGPSALVTLSIGAESTLPETAALAQP